MEEKFIMVGCISPAKIVFQICVCSGQVKGLLRYYCLHCMLASWQGCSTGISRSQLVGTTINSDILLLLWFCPEILVLFSRVSNTVLWAPTAPWGQELEWNRTWNMVSKRGMQEHIGYIHDVTGQKEQSQYTQSAHHQKNGSMQVEVLSHRILQFTEISNDTLSPPAPA